MTEYEAVRQREWYRIYAQVLLWCADSPFCGAVLVNQWYRMQSVWSCTVPTAAVTVVLFF